MDCKVRILDSRAVTDWEWRPMSAVTRATLIVPHDESSIVVMFAHSTHSMAYCHLTSSRQAWDHCSGSVHSFHSVHSTGLDSSDSSAAAQVSDFLNDSAVQRRVHLEREFSTQFAV